MNPDTIRTDLNPKEIVNIFDKKHSLKISIYLVKKLLKHKGSSQIRVGRS